MKIFDIIRNWPDEKKKKFSIVIALCITIVIAGTWFIFRSKLDISQKGDQADKQTVNAFTDSFQKISADFNSIKEQISGTTTNSASSTEESATSTTTP